MYTIIHTHVASNIKHNISLSERNTISFPYGLQPCDNELFSTLTHWGRVTHMCAGKLTIVGAGNGFLPGRRQAIVWTKVGILLTGRLGTNISEFSIVIQTFSFKKMHLIMLCANGRPFCLGLSVLSNTHVCPGWLLYAEAQKDTVIFAGFFYFWQNNVEVHFINQLTHSCTTSTRQNNIRSR